MLHLKAKGAQVYGFGAKKTPAPFVALISSSLIPRHPIPWMVLAEITWSCGLKYSVTRP